MRNNAQDKVRCHSPKEASLFLDNLAAQKGMNEPDKISFTKLLLFLSEFPTALCIIKQSCHFLTISNVPFAFFSPHPSHPPHQPHCFPSLPPLSLSTTTVLCIAASLIIFGGFMYKEGKLSRTTTLDWGYWCGVGGVAVCLLSSLFFFIDSCCGSRHVGYRMTRVV